uniref:Uncharacterized protein n=1 Tax=Trichuris muris TaxID=70415 RepID=A0A5S6R0X5_TRIMR
MGSCCSRSSVDADSASFTISYKASKSLAKRREETALVKSRFPNKLPVVIERHYKETVLPAIEKNKFLVPKEATMIQLLAVLRNRLNLRHGHTFYFLINGRTLVTSNETIMNVYEKHVDDDGFLYLTYTSKESFG